METTKKKEFLRIVDAYLEGIATDKQKATAEQYYDLFEHQPLILDHLDQEEVVLMQHRIKSGITAKISGAGSEKKVSKHFWKYLSIAASIVFIAAIGTYLITEQHQLKDPIQISVMQPDIAPGSNKAILTLSNGTKISLSEVKVGEIAQENGGQVKKTSDGEVVYSGIKVPKGKLLFNRIETPKGGQYQITLPDGSRVWLNATSSLRYPVAFSSDERSVELTGEAYFEVAKDKSKPFKVNTIAEQVQVLGTHFNINAYSDEPFTKTSLVEGTVRVVSNKNDHKLTTLRPGQQSIINSLTQTVVVKNIDVEEVVSWKNGYFMFDEEPLESILRKVSRWYDVDIDFSKADASRKLSFSGTLSRYSNISKLIRKLELTQAVRFKIEGRKITVIPISAN